MRFVLLFFSLVISFSLNAQNLKEKADNFYLNGNYTKAIEAYKSLENLDDVYDAIAKSYLAIGNYGEAVLNYEKAIKANEDKLLIKYEFAKLLTKTKKYSKAKQVFTDLIVLDSINPNYHYELGVVLEKQKDTTAYNEFKKTFDLDQTHQKAIFKIAKHHLIKRNYIDAHGFIDRGLEGYEANVELISLKAQTYYYQDYYTHAIVWFNRLLDLGEKSEFIHEKLSLSYAQNSDYKDAIYHRKEALKYNPTNANAMFVIGTYYESLSNFKKAEEYITKALKLQDQSLSNEYLRLGTILNRQKKYEKAIKVFQKALKEDPSNISAEFFMLRTKEEYYADMDTKIELYKNFSIKHKGTPYAIFADRRVKELQKEKFLEED